VDDEREDGEGTDQLIVELEGGEAEGGVAVGPPLLLQLGEEEDADSDAAADDENAPDADGEGGETDGAAGG
jgi:hypothetical protein